MHFISLVSSGIGRWPIYFHFFFRNFPFTTIEFQSIIPNLPKYLKIFCCVIHAIHSCNEITEKTIFPNPESCFIAFQQFEIEAIVNLHFFVSIGNCNLNRFINNQSLHWTHCTWLLWQALLKMSNTKSKLYAIIFQFEKWNETLNWLIALVTSLDSSVDCLFCLIFCVFHFY